MMLRCFTACLKQLIVLMAILFTLPDTCICFADNKPDSLRISEYPVYDSLMPGDFFKFGIQSGYVYTKELNAGFDFGGRISQRFIHPFFQLTSQIHFWTGTRENHNTGVLGIEESIMYQIPVRRKAFLYGGFTVGFLSVLEEEYFIQDGVEKKETTWRNDIAPYITFGVEYFLENNRSFFLENKYGSSDISKEFHILTGMNFFFIKK